MLLELELLDAVGRSKAPLIEARAARISTMSNENILALSAEGNTYIRRIVAQPFRPHSGQSFEIVRILDRQVLQH